MSKAGVSCLTIQTAKELLEYGVNVNAIAPGIIDTPLWKVYGEEKTERSFRSVVRGPGSPSDIADAVLFLASPMARYITGEILDVNGGLLVSEAGHCFLLFLVQGQVTSHTWGYSWLIVSADRLFKFFYTYTKTRPEGERPPRAEKLIGQIPEVLKRYLGVERDRIITPQFQETFQQTFALTFVVPSPY